MYLRVRPVVGIVGLLGCLAGMVVAGQSGLSRFLVQRALKTNDRNLASKAVELTPADAEAHYTEGLVLSLLGEPVAAVQSFQRAASLRPQDYSIWLQLGLALKLTGNRNMARVAFAEATRRAPYYSEPRWQLGLALLNEGRREEAFAHLTGAANSNPMLMPLAMEMAWDAYAGDGEQVLQALSPDNAQARLQFATFLAEKGAMKEASRLFRLLGSTAVAERRRLAARLITAHRYRDAADIWWIGVDSERGDLIKDGSFEKGELSVRQGFWWQTLNQSDKTRADIDRSNSYSGSNSLVLSLAGAKEPNAAFVRQLVVVESRSRYQLTFATRVENSVNDGLVMVVSEAGPNDRVLTASDPISSHDGSWKQHLLEFETDEHTAAVYITLRRQKCRETPCQVFGRGWFDGFVLRKL